MIDFSHSVCNIRIYFSRLLKCHYLSHIHICGIFCWNMAINECNTTEEKKNTCNIILNGFWVTILWECTDVAETCLDMKDSIVLMMRRLTMIFDERISFVGDKSTWQSNYFYVTRDLLRMLKIWYDFTSENDIDAMLQHRNQTAYQTLDVRSLTIPCTNRFVFFFSFSRTYKKKHSTKDDK